MYARTELEQNARPEKAVKVQSQRPRWCSFH